MIHDSELQCLRRFVAAHQDGEVSTVDRLWAGRCAALLAERQRLEEQVEALTREVDAALEARTSSASSSNTWIF